MNRFIPFVILALILIPATFAGSADEITLIKQTAKNYMESWYQGDGDKMKASLHKKLAKRSLKDGELRQTKASSMVAWTREGWAKGLWRDGMNIGVEVLDFYKNIASVKVISYHYYEYLHLMKIKDRWVIINALYENRLKADN
jgi:hypothetical protein